MSYWGWKHYVSVAERQNKAEKAVAKAKKAGKSMSPIAAYHGALAKTFWGKAWDDNLERYSDFENRLPRGRTYVRNGSVIDLKILAGEVQAQVMGSELYKVAVSVTAVPAKQWKAIGADCSGSIDSLVELLQGKLSKAVMERICKPGTGLFPAPKEIKFSCSCPDWASMCKHVAAVLYGVGTRLDEQPELLFTLRRVDAKDLVTQAGAGLPKPKKVTKASKVLDDSALGDVFGIEMAEPVPAKPKPRSKTVAKKAAPANAVVKKIAPAKAAPGKSKALAKKATVKPTVKPAVARAAGSQTKPKAKPIVKRVK
jgi:uncharacterized Zn finger protein